MIPLEGWSIDQDLMDEIRKISDEIKPHYTFLVIDAMTGVEAVNVAGAFNEKLSIDAMILTKLVMVTQEAERRYQPRPL